MDTVYFHSPHELSIWTRLFLLVSLMCCHCFFKVLPLLRRDFLLTAKIILNLSTNHSTSFEVINFYFIWRTIRWSKDWTIKANRVQRYFRRGFLIPVISCFQEKRSDLQGYTFLFILKGNAVFQSQSSVLSVSWRGKMLGNRCGDAKAFVQRCTVDWENFGHVIRPWTPV